MMTAKPFRLTILLLCIAALPVAAENSYQPFYSGLTPVQESKAFKILVSRIPVTDIAILHYLIDRFEKSEIRIHYDDLKVAAPFAAKVAHWFLVTRYKNETPEQWILRWCNKTIIKNNLIWVELPGGEFLLSREILFRELDAVYAALEDQGIEFSGIDRKAAEKA